MRAHRAFLIGAMIGTLILVGAAGAVAGGGCISVRVDAPVELPDGSIYPAGSLRLCDTHELSPTST